MSANKEELKNKIIYRSSYRGTKEMDILLTKFVATILNDLNEVRLEALNIFVNMNDEDIASLKKENIYLDIKDKNILYIIDKFKKFKI